eukprot:5432485-Alexandrium_andersonii.AAC.1
MPGEAHNATSPRVTVRATGRGLKLEVGGRLMLQRTARAPVEWRPPATAGGSRASAGTRGKRRRA